MCITMTASVGGWRMAATDLGVNRVVDGEVREKRLDPDRLTLTPTGWVVGVGDYLTLALAREEVEDPTDTDSVLSALEQAAARAGRENGDHGVWGGAKLLTADVDGVSRVQTTGQFERGDPADSYFMETPPDVPMEAANELSRQFAEALDPEDPESAILASEAVVAWLAERSDHVTSKFAVGLLQKDGDTWEATRYDCSVGGTE